jgi:hypothetical protein
VARNNNIVRFFEHQCHIDTDFAHICSLAKQRAFTTDLCGTQVLGHRGNNIVTDLVTDLFRYHIITGTRYGKLYKRFSLYSYIYRYRNYSLFTIHTVTAYVAVSRPRNQSEPILNHHRSFKNEMPLQSLQDLLICNFQISFDVA